jgi:hypothetical protein
MNNKTPNIDDFDPKIQKQIVDWITRFQTRILNERKKAAKETIK